MTFVKEFDGLRLEARKDTATTFSFWPKVDGSGGVLASATAGDCTFAVYTPTGELVQAATNTSPVTVGGVSRLDLAIPAISALAENYRITVLWKVSAESFARQRSLFFDVVTEPWGPSPVSLNSMQSLIPAIAARLTMQAAKLATSPATSADELASIYGFHARTDLDEWLRSKISDEAGRAIASGVADSVARAKFIRPRLVLNRERLFTVELKLALACVFRADMTRAPRDGVDEKAAELFAFWRDDAEQSFRALGPLLYDYDEDLSAENELQNVGRVQRMRRRQA